MATIFMNTVKQANQTGLLDLTDTSKNMALANLSVYYIWKNIKSEYNNDKSKISAPT